MLEWANHLLALAYEVEVDGTGQPQLDANGAPVLKLDTAGKPIPTSDTAAAAALKKYVDFVDTMRQLTHTFEMPLDDSSLPQP